MKHWPALDVTFNDPASDELLQAALHDFTIAAIEETTLTAWRVVFHDACQRDRALTALRPRFPDVGFVAADIPDEDWAARSQASLRAIDIGTLVIAPPWDVPRSHAVSAFRRTVVIQPSMGFGTGHHATTRLCLLALQTIDLTGHNVLDVGTGSGVLAIAASVLGAARALGIDDDPDAIQAARENVALNPEAQAEMRVADLRSLSDARFDVVLANLTGGLLIASASRLVDFTAQAGSMVLSGFMDHEEAAVLGAFAVHGFAVEQRSQEDEWVCVVLGNDRHTVST
jgi:ribosomal protein L11 methyltransferase